MNNTLVDEHTNIIGIYFIVTGIFHYKIMNLHLLYHTGIFIIKNCSNRGISYQ